MVTRAFVLHAFIGCYLEGSYALSGVLVSISSSYSLASSLNSTLTSSIIMPTQPISRQTYSVMITGTDGLLLREAYFPALPIANEYFALYAREGITGPCLAMLFDQKQRLLEVCYYREDGTTCSTDARSENIDSGSLEAQI